MEILERKERRYHYLDVLRVFSIGMVMVLHTICDYYMEDGNVGSRMWYVSGYLNEAGRIGVPIFFMISGYLLLKEKITDIKSFYLHRLKKVGIPFLFYDVLYYLIACGKNHTEPSLGEFVKELLRGGSDYHLWFIYSIIFLYFLIPFVQMIVEKCSRKMLWFFFLMTVFQTTLKPLVNTVARGTFFVYLTEDGFCGYLGYMVLGYILGEYSLPDKAKKAICFMGIISFVVVPWISMVSVKNGGEFLFHGGYTWNHYLEAAAVFLFCKQRVDRESKGVSILSAATMDAYFIHVWILETAKGWFQGFSPLVTMGIWFAATAFFSFLWGILKVRLLLRIKKKRFFRREELK